MKRMQILMAAMGIAVTLAGTANAAETTAGSLLSLIAVQAVRGTPHRPIALTIRAPIMVNNDVAYVLLSDVPAGAILSTGVDVEAGNWLIDTRSVHALVMAIPQAGEFRITAQLLDAHFKEVSAPASFLVTINKEAALLSAEH